MNSPSRAPDYISGIYNFCDRWCEQCPLAARCRVYSSLQESGHDGDVGIEEALHVVSESLAEAKEMLIAKAEELGLDVDSISDEEFAEIDRRQKEFVESDDLSPLVERYWRSAKEILDKASEDTASLANYDPLLDKAFATLLWYLFFIPVSIKSGLNGLLDEEGLPDDEQLTDSQSYSNGTIKVALIAIERSTYAWAQLAESNVTPEALRMVDLLQTIRQKVEARFPLAYEFVRPGFDELEGVM